SGAVLLAGLGLFWGYRARTARRLPAPAQAAAGFAAPRTPDVVLGGNFRIVRELGRGGMGVVFEALDLALERKVAVKRMREELCQSPKDVEAFLDEARMVAALRHPNIVEIHSVLWENGSAYLVFEFVPGEPLNRTLGRGRLDGRPLTGLLSQLASALDYAHSRKVIHRDLKPANIMLTAEGTAKVMDFGLAHRAKMTVARLTRAKAAGTFAYMAPEQELGSVSRESDLYALGVCVYEMAVGRLPFEGPNFLVQKRELRYVPPSKAAGLSPAFDALIAKALQLDPARRFHSAAELLAAVEAARGKT
ncbi:MAG: serine/threonine-protein kinase, partial [Chloroflexota bacterium]